MCDTCHKGTYTEPRGDVLHGHCDNPSCMRSFEAKAHSWLRRGERACPWFLVEGSTDKWTSILSRLKSETDPEIL